MRDGSTARSALADRVAASERARWFILGTALFGLFAVGVSVTLLSVSLGTISRDLGSSTGTLTWVVTGPMLGFAVAGPAFGKIGDLYGHRRVYLVGLTGAAVFALLTGLAPNAIALIAFRLLGATIGSATSPTSMAMLNQLFPERRAQAMGFWSLVTAGGPVLGVVVGGPAVDAFGWRVIFFAQAPVIALAVIVCWLILPETARRHDITFDVRGTVLLSSGAVTLILAINQGPALGWGHPFVIGGFVATPVLLAAFARWERRVAHPLLPLHYLGRRNFSVAIGAQMLTNVAYTGGFVLTPLLLEEALGYSTSKTGLVSIARPLAFAVAGPLSGSWSVRLGERTLAVFGACCVAASMVGLASVDPGSTTLVIVVALALSGIGLGSLSPSMAASVANSVEPHDLGVAGAAQQMLNQIGSVTGFQVLHSIQAQTEASSGLVGSYRNAYLTGAVVAVSGAVVAGFVHNSRRGARSGAAVRSAR